MRAAPDHGVFRALSDPSRRRILDILRRRPGLNASALSESFSISRIAVTKHLDVLEEGGLVVRRRDGRAKALFVDDAALAEAMERWLAKCAPHWTRRLGDLKRSLEGEGPTMDAPRHVYVVYIRTTPQKLWDALTRPEMTRQYFFGTDVRGDMTPGAPIEYVLKDPQGKERIPVTGEVIEAEPLKRLVHTFRFAGLPDLPTRVTYEIAPAGKGVVKLTLTHEGFDGETKTYKEVGGGWPRVVSQLKTLLETGTVLALD